MTNITVKKADGTTDVTYQMKVGSTSTSPAVYRNETASSTRAMQPTISFNVVPGSNASTRRADINGGFPGSDGVDLTKQVGKTSIRIQVFTSDNVVTSDTAEGVHQLCNFVASQAVKQAILDGFGPRSS